MSFYNKYSVWLKERFQSPVRKITLNAGLSCPNRDGTLSTKGCVFCSNEAFSPAMALNESSISGQMRHFLNLYRSRYGHEKYIAFFQSFSNTHAAPEVLKKIYSQALIDPDIVGLAVSTRPDCIDEAKLDLLAKFAEKQFVSLELGVQSIYDRSLQALGRGHSFDATVRAVKLCKARNISLTFHVILGLPDEGEDEARMTGKTLGELGYDSIKIHSVHVCKNTVWENEYKTGHLSVPTLQEHVERVVDFLEHSPPSITVQRIMGDAPKEHLIAPLWCLEKQKVLAALDKEFARRGSFQGKFWKSRSIAP